VQDGGSYETDHSGGFSHHHAWVITSNSVWARGEGMAGHYGGGFGVNGRHMMADSEAMADTIMVNSRQWQTQWLGARAIMVRFTYSPYYVYLPPYLNPKPIIGYYAKTGGLLSLRRGMSRRLAGRWYLTMRLIEVWEAESRALLNKTATNWFNRDKIWI